MQRKLFIVPILVVFILTTGLQCKISSEARKFKPVALEYWGVFEDPQDVALLTNAYTSRHPKITVRYTKFREDEYKQKLLEGWALGKGPDLFMIPNTRIREFLKFIEPMPATMKVPVQVEKGTIKKEIIDEVVTYNGYTPKKLRDTFLDVVADDVLINNSIYGIPYSVDTLSVFYNRDILKNNNIALPAKNWKELILQANVISKLDDKDNLVESTIAMGTTNNIPTAFETVSALMMQLGITISNSSGVVFQNNPESLNPIQFYLSFAQKGLENYSWNKTLPNALDAFTAGKLAYFIGFPFHQKMIKDTNPKLDFDVIPLFKPEGAGISPTYASYWVTVVAKPPKGATDETRSRAEIAWQYILESTQAGNVRPYLANTRNPRTTALRELVEAQKNDPVLGPFAQNLISAKSWYKGYDYDLAKKAFLDMITNIEQAYQNDLEPTPFLQAGGNLIIQTYQAPRQ